jgi:hypothetical protein
MSNLSRAAYELCLDVWAGAWNDAVKRVTNEQPAACPEVIETLRLKCPGYSTAEYQAAIAHGMWESMW